MSARRPLERTRTALLLYAILVVLPTVVFGGLHWHQLVTGHGREFAALPYEAQGAAERLERSLRSEVQALLAEESARPFYVYREEYWPPSISSEVAAVRSPLATMTPPDGVLAYYSYDRSLGEDADFTFLAGYRAGEEWEDQQRTLREVLRSYMAWERRFLAGAALLADDSQALGIELELPASRLEEEAVETLALNLSETRDEACLREGLVQLQESAPEYLEYEVGDFQLIVMQVRGRRQVFAHRLVDFDRELPNAVIASCFERLEHRTTLAQGFFLHPDHLHEILPRRVAERVLEPSSQRLLLGEEALSDPPPDQVQVSFDLAAGLPVRTIEPADPIGLRMGVLVDGGNLRAAFRRQALWFLGVAAMMIVSLAVGMGLLVHSVSASLERARRTENFVAAVTHELRTPIAAVKMYGEMLREGWVQSPEKQHEYFERIVRETNRLDTLVDRVLQKRKLGAGSPEPRAGDLSAEVEGLVPELVLTAGTIGEDLEFDLAPDLPPVLLLPESVRAIVQNLVENARKYAPAAPGGERIRVATRLERGQVVLEVSDRGPGIPEHERGRIFEAFYRVGDERTRTRPGTGLGLHIVDLQSQAMRARVQVLGRPGGGTTFRITFRRARA